MTMLTHPGSAPVSCRSGRRETAGPTIACFAVMKRFWLAAFGALLAAGAVTGIIALRAAIALSHINY